MFPQFLPPDLVDRIRGWDGLKRWERKEIGQTLRRMGLSYKEISAVIPVHKGTLSGWCRDLEVPDAQRARIGTRRDVGSKLRRRALDRTQAIRDHARREATSYLTDPLWVAGVVAYWSEGSKRSRDVSLANSDPVLVGLFIEWAERYLEADRTLMSAKLHLHTGQLEEERMAFWSSATGIPARNFKKTFLKPEGTGHRKNVLYNGTILVRVPRSGDRLHRVMGWIDALAEHYSSMS
jgi:hypothetical protein